MGGGKIGGRRYWPWRDCAKGEGVVDDKKGKREIRDNVRIRPNEP